MKTTGARRTGPVSAVEPFSIDVRRRRDVAIVQPCGELDLVTVESLRAALEEIALPGRLVLDLRGLSFIDSTGLHLLIALHRRAQREGFQLALIMPPAPADRAIELSGLAQALPFAAPSEAVDGEAWAAPAQTRRAQDRPPFPRSVPEHGPAPGA